MKLSDKLQNLLKSNNLLKQNVSQSFSLSNPCLISDYLEASLYNAKNSFYKSKPRIGRIEGNLAFNKMRGSSDYINELNRLYPKGRYLTASEQLKPYFGYSLANYIMRTQEQYHSDKPIIIVEIGCGMGIFVLI
jgi:SAM-dependent MidA family methyltransferase